MKELSIEDKAKRYDEAYKVAKNIHIFSSDFAEIKRMEEIFPELKEESEDERIRKKICKLLWDNVPYEEAQEYIAWLEKQGEQNYKIIKGKNYFCVKTHNYAGVEWIKGTKYYASDNYTLVNQGCEYYCPEYSKEEHNNLFEEVKCDGCVEKQDEQKPVFEMKTNQGTLDFEFENNWRLVEQKPTWGEGDETILKILNKLVDTTPSKDFFGSTKEKCIFWLKSLKDRVQPKQEWSEKDKHMLQKVIDFMKHPDLIKATPTLAKNTINWLESLRPQNTWKPSDEQMKFLSKCIEAYNEVTFPTEVRVLSSLYNDLKKLKG